MICKVFAFSSEGVPRILRVYDESLTDCEIRTAIANAGNCSFINISDFTIIYKKFENLVVSFVVKDENEMYILNLINIFVSIYDNYFGGLHDSHFIYNFIEIHRILDCFICNGIVVEVDQYEILKNFNNQIKK